jgi:hypothetical protein
MMKDNSLQLLDTIVVKRPRDEKSIAGIGLELDFFLYEGSNLETRLLLEKCSDDYLNRYEQHVKKSVVEFGRWRKPKAQSLANFLDKRGNSYDNLFISHSGAANFEDLSWYTFRAGSSDEDWAKKRKSYASVRITIPLSDLEGKPQGSFQQWFLEWTELLNPVYAYGGFGLIFPLSSIPSYRAYTYPLLMRFPGLDDATCYAKLDDEILLRQVRIAQWFTYLNPHHIKALGGLEKFKTNLGEGFGLTEVAEGILIQAGATPQLGDVNQNIYPAYYYRLGKVLESIRYKPVKPVNCVRPPQGTDSVEAAKDWLARFDKGIPNE